MTSFITHPFHSFTFGILINVLLCAVFLILAYGVGCLALGFKRGVLSPVNTTLLGVGVLAAVQWCWAFVASVFLGISHFGLGHPAVIHNGGLLGPFPLGGLTGYWINKWGGENVSYMAGLGGFLDWAVMAILALVLALAWTRLVFVLYRKWIRSEVTEEESFGGREGFRAWLHSRNVIPALLAAVAAKPLLGVAFWPHLLLWLGALCAYPAYQTLWKATEDRGTETSKPIRTNGEEEQLKVMDMLNAGKISRDEADDLLNALRRQ